MQVFAVQRYRIDTMKENDHVLRLYTSEAHAQKHVDNLNSLYSKDDYCTYRARVEPMEVCQDCELSNT